MEPLSSISTTLDEYDIVVIGGGVVGCAILYQLSNQGYRSVLVEKQNVLLSGASSGNSGMVHCGFDATPGTLESECLGMTPELETFCSSFSIPYKKIGAIMIAKSEEELLRLDEVERSSQRNGIRDVKKLTKEEVLEMEPNLNGMIVYGGLHIPGEAVIDSWLLPVSLAHQAVKNGAKVELGCEIVSGEQISNGSWSLRSRQGAVQTACVVVNAAGLYGDIVEEICHPSAFSICPRKGQFVVYGQEAGHLINHIILPVPSERSKGVLIYPSVHGNLVVGPTADDCVERTNPIILENVTKMLVRYGQNIVPSLAKQRVVETYAGIRPATQYKDFQLGFNKEK